MNEDVNNAPLRSLRDRTPSYSYQNQPASQNIARKRLVELDIAITTIERDLKERKNLVGVEEYEKWKENATKALEFKSTERWFLTEWTQLRTSGNKSFFPINSEKTKDLNTKADTFLLENIVPMEIPETLEGISSYKSTLILIKDLYNLELHELRAEALQLDCTPAEFHQVKKKITGQIQLIEEKVKALKTLKMQYLQIQEDTLKPRKFFGPPFINPRRQAVENGLRQTKEDSGLSQGGMVVWLYDLFMNERNNKLSELNTEEIRILESIKNYVNLTIELKAMG